MLSGVSRRWLSFAVLFGFVTIVLFLRIVTRGSGDPYGRKPSEKQPDYAQYIHVRTLSDEETDFANPNRRVIVVGDIHGMKKSLDKLLDKLEYTPSTDLLIHTGDVMTKGPDPIGVLTFLAENNIAGVRGNHDQKIVQWRAWVDDVLAHHGGREWLERKENKSELEIEPATGRILEPWKNIPDGWIFMGPHYRIAREISQFQYDYLRSLPLVLHIPTLHAFVVHAGILPFDPRRSVVWPEQPFAHKPDGIPDNNVTLLRITQERAVLKIQQNTDPWVVLNMRSVLKNSTISRDTDEGTFWADLWNSVVERCGGFDLELEKSGPDDNTLRQRLLSKEALPCRPSTVIYGHTASLGLDIRRWTKGLDSGCVYGRRLSSLVLTPPEVHVEDHALAELLSKDSKKRFGDRGFPRTADARIESVSCPEP